MPTTTTSPESPSEWRLLAFVVSMVILGGGAVAAAFALDAHRMAVVYEGLALAVATVATLTLVGGLAYRALRRERHVADARVADDLASIYERVVALSADIATLRAASQAGATVTRLDAERRRIGVQATPTDR